MSVISYSPTFESVYIGQYVGSLTPALVTPDGNRYFYSPDFKYPVSGIIHPAIAPTICDALT